jgi:DNA-binding CsgD family transcriptional regulator
VLDEVDYGLLIVTSDARVLHANRAALAQLADDHPIELDGLQLRMRSEADLQRWRDAFDAAARHLRRLLTFDHHGDSVTVAVVPVATADDEAPAVLVLLGRRRVSQDLSIDWFARTKGLTSTETGVLKLLCDGLDPKEIALRQHVAISTVRTQISRIREKTEAGGIRDLLRQVVVLPPMMSAACCGRYHGGHASRPPGAAAS